MHAVPFDRRDRCLVSRWTVTYRLRHHSLHKPRPIHVTSACVAEPQQQISSTCHRIDEIVRFLLCSFFSLIGPTLWRKFAWNARKRWRYRSIRGKDGPHSHPNRTSRGFSVASARISVRFCRSVQTDSCSESIVLLILDHFRCSGIPSKCSRVNNYDWECMECKHCMNCREGDAVSCFSRFEFREIAFFNVIYAPLSLVNVFLKKKTCEKHER